MSDTVQTSDHALGDNITIRRVTAEDLAKVVSLDARVTGKAKPDYWADIFERYAARRVEDRFFLVADAGDDTAEFPLLGFVVGEVRGWEFGSEPCGWIFALSVEPETRQQGIGKHLFKAMSDAFKLSGIKTMRTMVARQSQLPMAFFRSEGMVAGPYIQLEMDIDDVD